MKEIYLIGNAHLDPAWMWTWQEGFAEILATFKSALDRMEEFSDFKFTSACGVYYEWIEKIDSHMFEQIKKRVIEGRWCITGGWFLQPDCNIPSGESFARHALISQRYFKEKFGIVAKTGYNADSFGHNASLPKILKKSCMENYVFMRPDHNEKELTQNLFLWESDNGDSILTHRIPWYYNIGIKQLEYVDKLRQKCIQDNLSYMLFYGVGNHGGGPTIKLIDVLTKANNQDLVFSTPDEYFTKMKDTPIKILKGELQHHARGCYSACTFVKKNNRKCEQNLIAAEKFAVMAKELTGMKYPHKKLKKAWKNLLFNQFHDILGGCSIKKVYEDASYLYGEAMSITEQIINEAISRIVWSIDTLQGAQLPSYKKKYMWETETLGSPIVVFNPHSHEVCMPVSVYAYASKITDAHGNEIPFQIVRGDQTQWNDVQNTAFVAKVPAYGYTVYNLFTEKESIKEHKSTLSITKNCIENDLIKVEFDLQTGDICSFLDKENGTYIINKPCRAILLDETDCDTWAHDKNKLGEICGVFINPEFRIIEYGNVRATLQVITTFNNSTIIRKYSIIPQSKTVKVDTIVDFHEKHKALKFAFPQQSNSIVVQIPYSTITRNGDSGEESCGMWISCGDMCIANDSKYAYDTENNELRLTILRSAIYADHFGQDYRDDLCEFMEQGIHEFSYSIYPYTSNSNAEQNAAELNFGLRVVSGSFHNGTLPLKKSCFATSNPEIIVSATKEHEDSSENIIRFFEINGQNTDVKIKLFDREIKTNIAHNDIKTISDSGKELNFIEWQVK